VMESFGRLFKSGLSLYVFPWKNRRNGELVTAENFVPPDGEKHLYRHFRENGMVRSVPCKDEGLLQYTGRDIQHMIENGDERWVDYVPEEAHVIAARRGLNPH